MGNTKNGVTRRGALKTGGVMTGIAMAAMATPGVYAWESNTVQVALVGCGGRGTGAAQNALSTKSGPIKLTAMADVFSDRLENSYNSIKRAFDKTVDVPTDRKFIGFDGYKKAMDSLKPGDVVILTTPPAFRWVMFSYAIEKGLNVFMEKPTTVDGPSTRRMLELASKSEVKNLKVGVGLMCRHCMARGELFNRVKGGELGDIVLLRAYRVAGPTGSAFVKPKPQGISDLQYQIRNFHGFLWLSGGAYSDFLIHNIDECCWMKDSWPVSAKGYGGRHYRDNCIDQNFDNYSTEFTFADGAKLILEGRYMPNCDQEFASYMHGTKGSAVVSQAGHWPSRARQFKGQNMARSEVVWEYKGEDINPYQLEWDRLIEDIRQDKKHNECRRGAEASLVTAMGRMACHTGKIITYEEMLNCEHELGAPVAKAGPKPVGELFASVDKLTLDGPSPLMPDKDGKYPIPRPGQLVNPKREY
ncbi:MAG: Gfo/Idh/MocA family oxidoreductase [Gemmataceae bacterium]|nr:Gfo/Idh/MocA family oxidoreductase [Gemmataceae bacterium]